MLEAAAMTSKAENKLVCMKTKARLKALTSCGVRKNDWSQNHNRCDIADANGDLKEIYE
jgi:hypothetical protein